MDGEEKVGIKVEQAEWYLSPAVLRVADDDKRDDLVVTSYDDRSVRIYLSKATRFSYDLVM